MTGTFKANNPYNNFLLLLYGLLIKLPVFLYPKTPVAQNADGFLYRQLLSWLKPAENHFNLLYSIVAFFLIYIQAVSFNKLVNGQRLMQKPNYLTGMCYLLITSLFNEWSVLSAPLIINTLLIGVMARLANLNSNPNPKASLFNSGMIIGIATFFYFPSIAFTLLIIVGLLIIRPIRLPEWIMVLIGIITPYYLGGSILYLTGNWNKYKIPDFSLIQPQFHETKWGFVAIGLLAFLVVIGAFYIQQNLRRQVVQVRKTWGLVFLFLAVALFVPFMNSSHGINYWVLTAVPISAIVAAAFLYPEKKWFPLVMHWGLVGVTVIVGYFMR